MSGDTDRQPSGEMTLAFTLAAIERFADPATVFAEAREWSRSVGIVANDADAVAAFVDEHGLRHDFDVGEADKWLAMERIRESTATPRHVFVGASVEDRRIADQLGWEYRTPEEVAEKADWALAGGDSDGKTGLVARLKDALPGV
jgi:hypothetical protein